MNLQGFDSLAYSSLFLRGISIACGLKRIAFLSAIEAIYFNQLRIFAALFKCVIACFLERENFISLR